VDIDDRNPYRHSVDLRFVRDADAGAERSYAVSVHYNGESDELVKLADRWVIDEAKTAELRRIKP
jgi:hypothetical protein